MLHFFSQNLFLGLIILLTSVFLVVSFYKPRPKNKLILIFLFATLSFFQIKTVNFRETYKFTPSEIDLQIQRMNSYPPKLAKLGYILEYKKEVQLLGKLQKNFFDSLDINLYFPNYFSFLTFPFFLYGIYLFFQKRNRLQKTLLAYCLLLLTFLGIHGQLGPFIIFPFLLLLILIGILRIIKLDKYIYE
jgi:hypothetical protein